jgi:putative FmdB family regulatory protein
MSHAGRVRYLMPIYEFECNNEKCEANARYDQEFSIAEPHDLDCPFCGESMRKVYSSVPAVVFKGSGFYSTDK